MATSNANGSAGGPTYTGSSASADPSISYPTNRPQQRQTFTPQVEHHARATTKPPINSAPLPKDLFLGQPRALSGISLRSFLLGLAFGISSLATAQVLFWTDNPLWRAPFFLASLSLFHFLEFYITAAYNTPAAIISSFLLTNGMGYNIAHTTAISEVLVTPWLLKTFAGTAFAAGLTQLRAFYAHPAVISTCLGLMVVGQITRSLAMVQAATNFNHQMQRRRNEGHVLVKDGIYSILRHPSYFGFFWWAIACQVVLGNSLSLLGFIAVLWRFFSRRIVVEERFLINFFGGEYVQYRKSTIVGIPFIR